MHIVSYIWCIHSAFIVAYGTLITMLNCGTHAYTVLELCVLLVFIITHHTYFQFNIYFTCQIPAATLSKESNTLSSEEAPLPPTSPQMNMSSPPRAKPFNPFCNVDQSQISIHCHINAVTKLLCVPGMVPKDLSE